MRLQDRVLLPGTLGALPSSLFPLPDFLEHIRRAVAFDITNVDEYLVKHFGKLFAWDYFDNIRPPFPCMWLDWRSHDDHGAPTQNVNGGLLLTTRLDDETLRLEYFPVLANPDRSKYAAMLGRFAVEIDNSGKPNPQTPRPITHLLVPEDELAEVRDRINNGFSRVVFALQFMNCINVHKVENEGTFASRAEWRRATKKDLPKPFRFYTLQLGPVSDKSTVSGKSPKGDPKMSLHICRGHFRTYTAEKPLLGRYVGTFWIPAHVRGSEKVGIVGKDYEVIAPAAPTYDGHMGSAKDSTP